MKTQIPSGVHALAILCSIAALTVSIMQGGEWLSSMGGADTVTRYVLYGAAVALIIGNQVLARLIGITSRIEGAGLIQGLTVLCWFGIAVFSVMTSTNAITKSGTSKIKQETYQSPEWIQYSNQITNYQNQLGDLRDQMNSMPSSWITRRTQMSDRMNEVSKNMERLQVRRENISSSSTGEALSSIKSMTGLTLSNLAILAAFLLELLPTCINLHIGANTDRKKAKQEPKPKKSQAPYLQAV